MKIYQKLQLIKEITELTQEKLAKKLEVSFATLNSWINDKSIPHQKQQDKIDGLYLKCTGQKSIPDDVLQAKKEIILSKSKKNKNVIKKILKNPDIYDEFVLSLTYNTNSIEGSTLTEAETSAILFQNKVFTNKDLREILEAKNHQAALQYLLGEIKTNFKITEDFILKLHRILMNGIKEDAGKYRDHGVRIVGANVPTANYLKVPVLMEILIKEINKKNESIIELATRIHSKFERIHPFSDGNGRIGRLLTHAMLLRKDLAPAVIKQENRRFYYKYLNKSQREGDYSLLEDFLCGAILEGFEILER